jgi:hypothetical protein
MKNPIMPAIRAKGTFSLFKRIRSVTSRYGLTSARMDRSLHLFAQTLAQFDCGASFALTAVVLSRNRDTIDKYLDQNIEFLVHGHTHIDYSRLSPEKQLDHLHRARKIFATAGVEISGFRSPYLIQETHLHAAIEATGFSYVSNQPIMWNVVDRDTFPPSARATYERAIAFYDPWPADERPSLPQIRGQIVSIPVALPDDEMLIDRLSDAGDGLVERAWQSILSETHRRGELFTIQLHPERIALCESQLSAILSKARILTPSVWLARLDEIAAWWRARSAAVVDVTETDDGAWHLSVAGPSGTTILARGVQILGSTEPWADGYQKISAQTCVVRAASKPFIGVSPTCPAEMIGFLRQQGYVVQIAPDGENHSIYLDRTTFVPQDERPLLIQIEKSSRPLVRLGRWPRGSRSALVVSGDIDAITLWDYVLRLFGK